MKTIWLAQIESCRASGNFMQTYGCRRIQMWIQGEYRIHYNYKTVWRVMRKYHILSAIRRKDSFGNSTRTHPNLLNCGFRASHPNEKRATNISDIPTKQGVLSLSVIRDICDNSIVVYRISTTQNVKMVLDTVRNAMAKEKVAAELQLHSDQGVQYASHSYFTLT